MSRSTSDPLSSRLGQRVSWTVALLVLGAGCSDNATVLPDRPDYAGGSPAPLACVPNLDGRIDAGEVKPAIGVSVSYLVSPAGSERSVDVLGFASPSGLVFPFSTDYADDATVRITPALAADKWYGPSFPADAFVTPLDAAGSLENIGRHSEQGLLLLGIASRAENPPEGKTLAIYDPPVEVIRFPIQPGTSFVSVGEVKGATIRGLPYAGRDTYEVSVDATGNLVLPAFTFTEAHRVRTKVTVEPAVGNATTRRQVSYFFECFAEVVRVTSLPDEADPNFTIASEVRRIGF